MERSWGLRILEEAQAAWRQETSSSLARVTRMPGQTYPWYLAG